MSVGYIPLRVFVYPKNASNMPFDEVTAYAGGGIVKLDDPELTYLVVNYIHSC